MKRIFIAALVVCISACASQPEKTVTADQAVAASNANIAAASTQTARPSHKVFKDDYTLLHAEAPPSKRRTLLLGSKDD